VNPASVLAPALNRLNIRAAREDDHAAALALQEWEHGKNPWLSRTAEILRASVGNPRSEYQVCVAERDGELVGFAVYGFVSGTLGTGTIQSVLVAPRSRRAGIGHRLLQHGIADMASRRARVIVAELPGDPAVVRFRALLLSSGFVEETRIDDYYRDGLPQIISRLDL
jgi:ribosomal protein S18 acetylase RimI-like enzyme